MRLPRLCWGWGVGPGALCVLVFVFVFAVGPARAGEVSSEVRRDDEGVVREVVDRRGEVIVDMFEGVVIL